MLGQTKKYVRHLFRRFILPEDYFSHTRAQSAMVIHLGKAEIFKRQMTQTLHGLIRRESALAHLLEQFADGFGVQSSSALASQHKSG
jgi:hypothetical protein